MRNQPEFKSMGSYFQIHDRTSCAQAIRNGGIAALVSASFTAIVGVIGFFTSASDRAINYFLDPWILLDAALVAVLAFFVFRKSRFAATLMFVYFLVSKLFQLLDSGRIPFGLGGLVTIFMGLFFFTAMRASYVWHNLYLGEPSKP